MGHYVVDTNVLLTAANRNECASRRCKKNCLDLVKSAHNEGVTYLDSNGEILLEYRKKMELNGQPGLAVQFLWSCMNNFDQNKVRRVGINPASKQSYNEVPSAITESTFDRSDLKFVAVARAAQMSFGVNPTIYNATDEGWMDHETLVKGNGLKLIMVCGYDKAEWTCPDTDEKGRRRKS